jgi:hypothetical protein
MGRPKQFNREGVLDRAIPVFWKHGFANTTVQHLEEATGVNKSGLYSECGEHDFVGSRRRHARKVPPRRVAERCQNDSQRS